MSFGLVTSRLRLRNVGDLQVVRANVCMQCLSVQRVHLSANLRLVPLNCKDFFVKMN